MKIYIITAAIIFCSNVLAMEKNNQSQLAQDPFSIIVKASGYSVATHNPDNVAFLSQNIVISYNRTRSQNQKCVLRKLLSPCRYNPFKSKL